MKQGNLPSLTRVKEKFQITLPTHVREAMGIEVGDLLEAVIEQRAIVLRRKALIDDAASEALERGLADMKAGRVTQAFRNMQEFKKYLRDSKRDKSR